MVADYIIVGAGSAGCALAYRLSEAGMSVAVIEYGGSDVGPLIQMPAALYLPMNMRRYDWGYHSEAEPHLGGRRLACPRGKVIGGSSSINGMVYVRGHPLDYEFWAQSGAEGWGWRDVAPYFRRMECWHADGATDSVRALRGRRGRLHVTRANAKNPLFQAFLKAGQEAGYPLSDDYNGLQQEGFGAWDATIWRGQRWSSARAYLRPALETGRVRVVRGLATKIVFEGRRASGVSVQTGKGEEKFFAGREVILSASAINTPKLLLLSGIGPKDELKELGIQPRIDRAGVGRNLQDHLEVYLQVKCLQPVSLAKYWNLFSKARIGLEWMLRKTGVGGKNHFEVGAFIRSKAGVEYPDIQFHFLPIAVRYDGRQAVEGDGFQMHVGTARSPSRGWVKLASPDPFEPPRIQFNYMSEKKDWEDFRIGIRLAREILAQKAMADFTGKERQPGNEILSDEAIDAFIRDHAESAYHPCGTCKMGRRDDPMAVVDEGGCVIGAEGLRVVDSSIFPRITNGNINAPSTMVGEKMADKILGRTLAPEGGEEGFWRHPCWETSQR